jgi:hypothetical protein
LSTTTPLPFDLMLTNSLTDVLLIMPCAVSITRCASPAP